MADEVHAGGLSLQPYRISNVPHSFFEGEQGLIFCSSLCCSSHTSVHLPLNTVSEFFCLGHPALSTMTTHISSSFCTKTSAAYMGMVQCTAQEDHRHGQRKPEGFAYSETTEMCVQSLVEPRQVCLLAGNSAGCWSSSRVMEQEKISHLGRKDCQYSG